MAIYDFQCTNEKCNTVTEKLVRSDTPPPVCPECGCATVKLLSAPSHFNFNGSGFYETDYKQK